MRLTVIPSDGIVCENQICYPRLTWAGTPENIHALQWFENSGWLEFNDGTPNEVISALPDWANNAQNAWYAAANPPPPPAPTPEEIQAENKQTASRLLQETDWVEIASVSDPANNPHLTNVSDLIEYRNVLREIAVNPPSVPVDPWPTKPAAVWEA
jgi:hypothetical protein